MKKTNTLTKLKKQPQKEEIITLSILLAGVMVIWLIIKNVFGYQPLNFLSLISYNIPFIITFKIRDKKLNKKGIKKTYKDYIWDNVSVWVKLIINIYYIIKSIITFTNTVDLVLTIIGAILFYLYDRHYNKNNISKDRNEDITWGSQGHIYRSNDRKYIRKEIDKYYKDNSTEANQVINTDKRIKELVKIAGGPNKIKTYCFDKRVETMWPCPPNRKKKSKYK